MRPGLSSVIAVFGLALGGLGPAGGAGIDKYLPDNTEMVLNVGVRQTVDSAVFRKVFQGVLARAVESRREDQPLLGFLDPAQLREIERITVAFPPGPADRKAVTIVHGKFDLGRLKEVAEALAQTMPIAVVMHPAEKVPLYEIRLDDPPRFTQFAAFPEKDVLVASPSRDAILDALAKGAGRKTTRINKDLQALLAKVDQKQSVWLAGVVPAGTKKDLAKRPQLKAFADKMESFSGGVSFTDEIKAGFYLQMSEPQAATDLRQTLEVSKNLANLYISASPELKGYAPVLAEVLNAAQFTRQKALLGVEVTVPEELIEKGVKQAPPP